MASARLGDVLRIDSKVIEVGRTSARAATIVTKKEDGSIIANGRQIMLLLDDI